MSQIDFDLESRIFPIQFEGYAATATNKNSDLLARGFAQNNFIFSSVDRNLNHDATIRRKQTKEEQEEEYQEASRR
jgi:hypothetical protein